VAILRYRLYDLDVIIRRTLIYGSLTVILAAVYLASVVGMQRIVGGLTGDEQSAVVIALSTLLIAALFQPLRGRLQSSIDRRFYRRRYDTASTLARFAAALREDVDLAELRAHLLGVVEETMQPAHASLWLRHDRGDPREAGIDQSRSRDRRGMI
jgi:hypothetical protein